VLPQAAEGSEKIASLNPSRIARRGQACTAHDPSFLREIEKVLGTLQSGPHRLVRIRLVPMMLTHRGHSYRDAVEYRPSSRRRGAWSSHRSSGRSLGGIEGGEMKPG